MGTHVAIEEFDHELSFDESEQLLQAFYDSGEREWELICPAPSVTLQVVGGLEAVLKDTEWGFSVRMGACSLRACTARIFRVDDQEAQAALRAAQAAGWLADRSRSDRQHQAKAERMLQDDERQQCIDSLPALPEFVELVAKLPCRLYAVEFIDENTGWVCGSGGSVWRTNDGGYTWTQQHQDSERSMYRIAIANRHTLWVSGQGIPPAEGIVIGTTDGGQSWIPLSPPVGRTPESVFLIDADRGCVAGDHAPIYWTGDGGATWLEQDTGREYGSCYVSFVNEKQGCAVGEAPAASCTFDGGATWHDAVFSGVEPEYLFRCHFTDAEHGWAVGWNGVVCLTADGGRTWTGKSLPPEENMLSVFFTNNRDGWVVGGYEMSVGLLFRTSDGGDTWETFAAPDGECLNDVYFVNPSLGWAVGEAGSILRITP